MTNAFPSPRKPLRSIGSAQRDLAAFPSEVRRAMGIALRQAQSGRKSPAAKPLTGDSAFSGTAVMEVVEDFSGDTYRVVYRNEPDAMYLLDAFKKKSTSGIGTPLKDIARIKKRLKAAQADYAARQKVRGAG